MEEFWTIVEKNTAIRVPKHLQKILKLHGYDDASSIKSITTEDINSLEEFAKNGMEIYIGANDNPKDFYHIYYNKKSKFKITNGDRVKIMSVVNFVKQKLASEAGHYFFHQPEKTVQPPSIEIPPFQNDQLSSGDNFFYPKLEQCLYDPTQNPTPDPTLRTSLQNVCHTPVRLQQSKSEFIDLTSPMNTSVMIIDETPTDIADQLTKVEGAIDNEQNFEIFGGPKFNNKEMPACLGCQKSEALCVCVGFDHITNVAINIKEKMLPCPGCQNFKGQCVCVRFDSQCFCGRQCSNFRSVLKNYPNVHWKKALILRNKTDILNGTATTDRRNLCYG